MVIDGCVGVAAPHTAEELDPGTMKRRAEVERGVGRLESGHPGDAPVAVSP